MIKSILVSDPTDERRSLLKSTLLTRQMTEESAVGNPVYASNGHRISIVLKSIK